MTVIPCGHWGRKPLYSAKVGTGPSNLVMIKRIRDFDPGMAIQFAAMEDVRGMCVGVTPNWRRGTIWKIENDRIFIEL